MLLWILFALLAAAVVMVLSSPLLREKAAVLVPAEADTAVYREQLDEIAADLERGLIAPAEAASARAEVARRLLKAAADTEGSAAKPASASTVARGASAAVFAIPVLAISLYLATGSPGLPDRPLASREAPPGESAPIAQLIAKVETRLREAPDDGRGWDVIAPVYLRLGRAADAAHAFSQSIRLNGESPARLVGFAEATLVAGNGVVSEEVRKAAERIRAVAPERIEPVVWLALGKEQDGNFAGAAEDYRSLLARPPADDDKGWRKPVEQRLAEVEARLSGQPAPQASSDGSGSPASSGTPAAVPSSGPPRADVAAVEQMAPADQAKFIQGMVARLAARLKEDGKDLEGWQKLVRAYQVMGRKDEAIAALAEAKKSFAGDKTAETTLDEFARSIGLGS